MIHDSLAGLIVPIDSVSPHPRNVRQGDVGIISTSLSTNGQYRPIVVQASSGFILAGNHTWRAAKSLGWDEIAVQKVDVDDDRAIRIMLADNKANDAATYDDADLLDLLTALVESDQGLEGTLFSSDEIDDLAALLESPSLDEVLDDLGVHDGTEGFSATIKVSVSLETFERWQRLFDAQEGSDDERICRIIDRAS
jgi:ParB-like chromosome segregation protein Spo0J